MRTWPLDRCQRVPANHIKMIALSKFELANIVICTIVALLFIQQSGSTRPIQVAEEDTAVFSGPAGTTDHHHHDDDKLDDEGSDLADDPDVDVASLSSPRALSDYFTSLLQGGAENGHGAEDNRSSDQYYSRGAPTTYDRENNRGSMEPETPRVIKGMGFGKGFLG